MSCTNSGDLCHLIIEDRDGDDASDWEGRNEERKLARQRDFVVGEEDVSAPWRRVAEAGLV